MLKVKIGCKDSIKNLLQRNPRTTKKVTNQEIVNMIKFSRTFDDVVVLLIVK